jgi:chromosome segregation ATPase
MVGFLDTENARLQAALADARADLERHHSGLAKLQGELMAARLEIAGARGETVQFRGMVERAEAATRIEQVQLIALRPELAELERKLGSVQAELAALRGSLSWRMTAPLRRVVWRLNRLRARLRRPPPPLPAPADPNERYLFKPGEAAAERGETVTVERLYELSRAP